MSYDSNNNHSSNPQNPPRSQGNAPVDTLRDGALKVSIFRNERENGVSYSMDSGRIYTDGQGQIKESKSLSGSEPIRMARLLEKSYDRVGEFKAQMKQKNKDTERDR